MKRYYYADKIADFLDKPVEHIAGELSRGSAQSHSSLESTQANAWDVQIDILKGALAPYRDAGKVFFEYSIPRLGKRIDVVAVIGPVVFVLEFKVGEKEFSASALDQVCDYALDLKNFHESSHAPTIAPILIPTQATSVLPVIATTAHEDHLLLPIRSSAAGLGEIFAKVLQFVDGDQIDPEAWEKGRYRPTPTIIEAAMALYGGHSVEDIAGKDLSKINLTVTSDAVSEVITSSREHGRKSICFVTGVPGAGKTLVGLNMATKHQDKNSALYSVFLSGNGPLVKVLQEALARDKVKREKAAGRKLKKATALSEVKAFIQNIHHFRDDCLVDTGPPIEHVTLFDEAQRAWNLEQTSSFMQRKKGRANFKQSEPEFLISCLDRHPDWAVIVCLVGGGQEINTGEAGLTEWVESLNRSFPDWHIHLSSRLTDSEYGAGKILELVQSRPHVTVQDDLHLAVSMRSFRAENVSLLVKQLLDLEEAQARQTLAEISANYPIVLTRDLKAAKAWLKSKARGTERYGMVASSQAQRLKPHAIDVKSPMDPVHYFLDGKEDVRSSYYLEDVATEFHVQGLELDWVCVTWDADFRYTPDGWQHCSFVGDKWNKIKKAERQTYLKNAYRVLLTRARQGMVIVVPKGDEQDATRVPDFYDQTYGYLFTLGMPIVDQLEA